MNKNRIILEEYPDGKVKKVRFNDDDPENGIVTEVTYKDNSEKDEKVESHYSKGELKNKQDVQSVDLANGTIVDFIPDIKIFKKFKSVSNWPRPELRSFFLKFYVFLKIPWIFCHY